jgi:hypothetical protein
MERMKYTVTYNDGKINQVGTFDAPEHLPEPGDVYEFTRQIQTLANVFYDKGDRLYILRRTEVAPHYRTSSLGNLEVRCKYMTSVWACVEDMISRGWIKLVEEETDLSIPTLDEFVNKKLSSWDTSWPKNSYVTEQGFKSLYIRVTDRYIAGKKRKTIDLANLTATTPGSGAFTKLVEKLKKQYPQLTIFVENVLSRRFAVKLILMGFEIREHEPRCFYLLPEKDFQKQYD